ncbi:hypothetical protein JCM1841_000487 [Sporobolomyces salmonicolor]
MGLFHKKSHSNTLKGPSGFAYTADEEPAAAGTNDASARRPARTSTDHPSPKRTSGSSPRTSVDKASSVAAPPRRESLETNERERSAGNDVAADRVGAGTAAGLAGVGAGAGTAGRRGSNLEQGDAMRPQGSGVGDWGRETERELRQAAGAAAPSSSSSPAAHLRETAAAPHRHHEMSEGDKVLSPEDAKNAEHDHKYLEPVVHERRHIHTIEELERHRSVERHVHHVQHHVQPILDELHAEEVHLFRETPVTHIEEKHASTHEDRALLARLNVGPGTTTVIPHERVVVDKGETMVTEHIIHHVRPPPLFLHSQQLTFSKLTLLFPGFVTVYQVHHIVMPVWQRDLHEYFRLNPANPSAPAPYATSYTGPSSLGTSYYPNPNPASPAVQTGGSGIGVGGSVPSHVPKEGNVLVPVQGSKYEVEYVNREPVAAGETTASQLQAPEVVPSRNTPAAGNSNRSTATTTAEAERKMEGLHLGTPGLAR